MADDDNAAGGQGPGTSGNDGGTTNPDTSADATGSTGEKPGKDGQPFDPDRAQRTIEALRAEVKQAKADAKRADELETRLKQLEDEKLSDAEKQTKRLAELEDADKRHAAERRTWSLERGVYGLVGKLGIADPELALLALQARGGVEFDKDGQPQGLEDALAKLLEEKPHLKGGAGARGGAPNINGGDGAGSRPPVQLSAEEAEMAKRLGMPVDHYHAMKDVETVDDYLRVKAAQKTAGATT